jgi:hypothetical protein
MAWVQIQHAAQHSWDDHQKAVALLGDEKPEGLIVRAAGEVDHRWKGVSIWESKEAYERFVEARLLPAVRQAFGDEDIAAGPPPEEWFEAKHMMGP